PARPPPPPPPPPGGPGRGGGAWFQPPRWGPGAGGRPGVLLWLLVLAGLWAMGWLHA
ncbi:hypothetical protein I5K84_14485, partial [Pseudomonas aeruginosa]|nr:hypothetical protein [Pseudomonas aeruginosa]